MLQSVLIVGTGAFAQGLASLAIRSGATASYDIALGSRRGSGVLPGLEETPVRTLDDALPQADLVRPQSTHTAAAGQVCGQLATWQQPLQHWKVAAAVLAVCMHAR